MIKVKRIDYPESVSHNRKSGKYRVIPARYKCLYLYEGREIAYYSSTTDTLYLISDLIGHDHDVTVYERALTCTYKDAYSDLFDMLCVDKETIISEYTYA